MDEFEQDDLRRQAARFRPVKRAFAMDNGHVLAVMSCSGREKLRDQTHASLDRAGAEHWVGPRIDVVDGFALPSRASWWLFHPSARTDIRVGQARTFFEVLRVAASFPWFRRLTMFEDDVRLAQNMLDYMTATDLEDFALVSWFHQLVPNPPPAGPMWMIGPAREFSCNQAITMPAATVHALLASSQLKNWSDPHGADMLIGSVMPDAPVAYHFPNLVDHVGGDSSLVGNTGARSSPTFIGETADAYYLTRRPSSGDPVGH